MHPLLLYVCQIVTALMATLYLKNYILDFNSIIIGKNRWIIHTVKQTVHVYANIFFRINKSHLQQQTSYKIFDIDK